WAKLHPGKTAEELCKDADDAFTRPWTADQYPHLAAWLKANAIPLGLVVEATQRPQYFSPLVPGQEKESPTLLISALTPGANRCRVLPQAMTIRAMLLMGQEQYDEAWQERSALHRLARHLGRGSTLIEGLIGVAIENIALQNDHALLSCAKLKSKHFQ